MNDVLSFFLQRILTNGDYYEGGKLIIDGKIMTFANTSGNVLDIIETRYKILMVSFVVWCAIL